MKQFLASYSQIWNTYVSHSSQYSDRSPGSLRWGGGCRQKDIIIIVQRRWHYYAGDWYQGACQEVTGLERLRNIGQSIYRSTRRWLSRGKCMRLSIIYVTWTSRLITFVKCLTPNPCSIHTFQRHCRRSTVTVDRLSPPSWLTLAMNDLFFPRHLKRTIVCAQRWTPRSAFKI